LRVYKIVVYRDSCWEIQCIEDDSLEDIWDDRRAQKKEKYSSSYNGDYFDMESPERNEQLGTNIGCKRINESKIIDRRKKR
jgi:hypothetical protein